VSYRPSVQSKTQLIMSFSPFRPFTSALLTGTLVFGAMCQAQTSLTLDQCLVRARANSFVVKQSGLALQSIELSRRELLSTRYPQLNFSAGAIFAPTANKFGYDPVITDQGQLSSQLVLEQPLYDGGRRSARGAQIDLDIARLTKEQQQAVYDLDLEVRQSYTECLRAQYEVTLSETSVSQLSDYLGLVRGLNAGGAVPYTDLLRTQVELQNARIAADQASRVLSVSKYALAELMGTPADTAFSLSDSLAAPSPSEVDSFLARVRLDTLENLDLSVARLGYERSLADIREARLERMPMLSFVGDAGLLTSRENLRLPKPERISGLGYSVGLSFELPILDWGGRRLRVQQLELAAESSQLQTRLLHRSLATEYNRNLVLFQSARARLESIRANSKTAEDNFLLTKSKYAGGSATAAEVLSAQQLMTDSRLSEIETMAELATMQAKLERIAAH
jgi:outer membrane protein